MQNGFFDKTGQKAKDGSMKKWVANDALNYITVVTYDVASNYRELTGINAPLHTCAPEGSGQRFSIEDAIKYWTVTAGVPANKVWLSHLHMLYYISTNL
jgi:GH18 family chitinase